MSAKVPCGSLHALQLCRECGPRTYGNKQSSSCSGHCPFYCLFFINFISLFHWTHLSFCLYFLFFSYISYVSTQGYETLCFLSINPYKTTDTQRKIEIMQIFFLALFYGKSLKTSSVVPSPHSAKPRHIFPHSQCGNILNSTSFTIQRNSCWSSFFLHFLAGIELCFCHLIRELL